MLCKKSIGKGISLISLCFFLSCGVLDAETDSFDGCDIDETEPLGCETAMGLKISEHTDITTMGAIINDNGEVDFLAETMSDGIFVVSLDINGSEFGMKADPTGVAGWFVTEADFTLTEADVAIVKNLTESLVEYLGDDLDVNQDSALIGVGQYLSQFQAGATVKPTLRAVYQPGALVPYNFGNDGIVCIKKYTYKTCSWDEQNGTRHKARQKIGGNWGTNDCGHGDYSCMGRCGGGCSGMAWTLDCMEHDICSYHKCATGGPIDKHCGDEYRDAIDDYLAFWCNGK